ncbi:vesicle-associated protein 1-1-like [Andrographis paniculata]|uniref:vesicle-associated protein 1-1-like n=1 Tax=Andrographis paniculata TaxID=175694 RepID=UPI0021E98A29|nr:vesicle-associated protein 1-1-like [Andrographis paniculata]
MASGELLNVDPLELRFPFELKKQISCSLQLSNKTENHVAFKVKTTNPKNYCVRPNTGIVLPRSTCDIVVTMQAQKETPPDMQCKDKFLIQSVVASPGTTGKDVTADMFNKVNGKVEECRLKVVFFAPHQPPSPVAEGSEEGLSPRSNTVGNGNEATRTFADSHENMPEELLKRKNSKGGRVSITFIIIIIIGLLGVVLGGYSMKQ